MSPDELKELEKEVNKLKFKASQQASELHDLVEDRLLIDFENIPSVAETTYAACKKWSDKNNELIEAKKNSSN